MSVDIPTTPTGGTMPNNMGIFKFKKLSDNHISSPFLSSLQLKEKILPI
jgi:hypothetical protein